MNTQITFPNTVPLHYDRFGVIRVNGSRVTLETLVTAFKLGDPPAQIADDFPTVSVEQVNAVIDWYLTHQSEADPYLAWQEMEGERLRREIESQPGYAALREEVKRRWAQRIKT